MLPFDYLIQNTRRMTPITTLLDHFGNRQLLLQLTTHFIATHKNTYVQ